MKSVFLHSGLLFAGVLVMFWLAGCHRKPTRAELPELDPAAVAQGAMTAYDTNGDGAVAGEELKMAASITDNPGLPVKVMDKNSDGRIDKQEVESRVQKWIDDKAGFLMFHCLVTMDGKPLSGATVKYVPESFMGGTIEPAQGVTDANGTAIIAIAPDDLPSHIKGVSVIRPGFYKIEITHPSTSIPAKYNTETILGQEISKDALIELKTVHELTSR